MKSQTLHELLICTYFIAINAQHALHVATMTKPRLIYSCPMTQNGHHI